MAFWKLGRLISFCGGDSAISGGYLIEVESGQKLSDTRSHPFGKVPLQGRPASVITNVKSHFIPNLKCHFLLKMGLLHG